jgi:hypothetical protein
MSETYTHGGWPKGHKVSKDGRIADHDGLMYFFNWALRTDNYSGFSWEGNLVQNRRFADQTAEDLYREYAWVVINSGMKNQVAETIFKRFEHDGPDAVGHPGKREAIREMGELKDARFKHLKQDHDNINDAHAIEYLETLPWIGPITKYHLARNLGIDCAKPDRHLMRIAKHFGYDDVQEMCAYIASMTMLRIGTVDVILWRYMNLAGNNVQWND